MRKLAIATVAILIAIATISVVRGFGSTNTPEREQVTMGSMLNFQSLPRTLPDESFAAH
jgi:hypothetical protein